MKNIRVKVKIYKSEEIEGKKKVAGMQDDEWCYAFVDNGKGIYLAEIWGSGMWCYASGDLVDEKLFQTILKEDPDMYTGKNWHEYRSDVIKDVLILEEYDQIAEAEQDTEE